MSTTYQWANPENTSLIKTSNGEVTYFSATPGNLDYDMFKEMLDNGEIQQPSPYVEPTKIDNISDLTEAKSISANLVRTSAYGILQPTDWVVVRAAETGVEAPADITSFRESVRTASATKIAAIESKTDLESLKAYLRSDEYKNWPEQ